MSDELSIDYSIVNNIESLMIEQGSLNEFDENFNALKDLLIDVNPEIINYLRLKLLITYGLGFIASSKYITRDVELYIRNNKSECARNCVADILHMLDEHSKRI